jgi:hypothetical protein
MNTKRMWRFAVMPLALAGVAAIPFVGCNAADTLCCRDFVPGADLSTIDWGMQGDAEVSYGAFMQATADFTGTATAIVTDVANACQAIAVDLGAEPGEVKETQPDLRATAWCDLADTRLATAMANGSLTITYQPPSCTIAANVQASCEAKCSANVMCEITPAEIIARCDPGKLSGRCEANCTGTCEGSANLAVNCEGTCQGTCEGTCAGQCSNTVNGECRGSCDSTCTGQCRGSCAIDAQAQVQCNAECTGGCDIEVEAPKCKAELTPPKAECQGSAECSGSCKASASAKAECKEPSLEIEATGMITADVVSTLKLNLPKLVSVFKARGALLVSNAQLVVDAGLSLQVDGTKAVACLIPATDAIGQAAANIDASLAASGKISGRAGVN